MLEKDRSKGKGMEIGLYTLGDIGQDPLTGETVTAGLRMKEIIEAAKLADEAGLDVFGVGEHHRLDYATSAVPVVLAAIAQVTKRIKLTSATTVLSTVDPVRLYENFATLDLVSDGRAEIIGGRGALIESYPLFGYDINNYDELFAENLELLLELNARERVTWDGQFRSSLRNADIAPRPNQKTLPLWVGVGGTPESAIRAGTLGVGMALAILGGNPERFKPLVELYRQAGTAKGHPSENLKIAVTAHGYISNTTEEAKEEFYPYYSNYWSYVNRQRGMSGTKISRADFDDMSAPSTGLMVGSPQQMVEKILHQYELFGHERFLAQMDIGGLPFKKVAESIEFFATKVAPIVRKETAKSRIY